MSETVNNNTNGTDLSRDQLVVIDNKICQVKGSIKIDGQQTTVYHYVNPDHPIFDSYLAYVGDDGKLVRVRAMTAWSDDQSVAQVFVGNKMTNYTSVPKGKSITISAAEKSKINKSPIENGKLSYGKNVVIENKPLYVEGYIKLPNGQKRVVYMNNRTSPDHGEWYLDDNGKLQRLVVNHKRVIEGEFHNASGDKEPFEPSDLDKSTLGDDSQPGTQPEQSTESSTETPTETPTEPTPETTPESTNNEYTLKFDRYRMRYYINYGAERKNLKAGPYTAKDRFKPLIDAYDLTPGQGKKAMSTAIDFMICLGKIKYLLDHILQLSDTALRRDGEALGKKELNGIREFADEIAPTTFRLYTRQMQFPYLTKIASQNQKKANEAKKDEVEKMIYYYVREWKSQNINNKGMLEKFVSPTISGEVIDPRLGNHKGGYLSGRESGYQSISTKGYSGQLPQKPKTKTNNGISMILPYTNAIIDELGIILKHTKKAKSILEQQVQKIVTVDGFKSLAGTLIIKKEEVTGPILELERSINRIKAKYVYWKKKVLEYDKDKLPKKTKDGTSKTPKTTPKTETQTVGPTETPTEQPTERPTEEVTQPTTPPTSTPVNPNPTPSGGDNSNGGGGNYSYTGDGGGETVTEAPTTVTEPTSEDVIVEGNSYKLPTSSKPATPTNTTTNSGGGNSAIPVLAGLAAAAAAGIGAKAYIDRKNNRDNEEDGEFKAEDWSGDTDMSMEYQEPEDRNAETLDYDEPGYQEEETERYGARSNQDMENLQ